MEDKNYNDYIVYIDKLSKSFLNGKIQANKDITLRIKKNDIYALMGENGAGKSTLMSILFGIYKQDSGHIYIRGKEVKFNYAFDAHKEKIGMVHQHFKLVDEFTIHENIILGNEICKENKIFKNLIVDKKSSKNKINNLIKKYNLNLNINTKIKKLNVSEKQKVEILKLLFLDSEILIFDEPTAILSKFEIKQFLQMLRNFKKEGKTIILITHKLDEVFEVANRGAVIRKGQFIEEFDIKSINAKKISSLMVGREIQEVKNKITKDFGPPALIVKDLRINGNEKISFELRKGEILSIAGISGNGQSELACLITGITKPKFGQISILNSNNKLIDTTKMSITRKYKIGLGFVPEDRQKYGLILDDSIAFNGVLNKFNEPNNNLKIYKTAPFLPFFKLINWKEINKNAFNIVKNFDVQGSSSILDSVGLLSGGNQQKVIIGRELTKEANLLVLFQPTRGLDIGSIEMIHKKILEAKKNGMAILLFSYELPEIFALSDTIGVMNKNKIVKISPANELNIEKVGELMTTFKEGNANE